jgi:serine/threonine protein kinase/tetratricopeptide (TPR) repeat protein
MSFASWPRVKAIFDAVKDLDPAARQSALEAACGDDSTLYEEVHSLLSWDVGGTVFLEESPLLGLRTGRADGQAPKPGGVSADAMDGQAVGAYRITARIGQGGMGTVHRAIRADAAYEKAVAIKVISREMASDQFIRQFKQERQALAALDHPNIARLLDGGTTPDGRPYFIMEFVDGVPLDRYCETHSLAIEQRLTLFRSVCSAVQYAHENLIVHRDIKPDNILVTANGVPKLLDFGIAKLLDRGAGASEAAEPGGRLMTPDFASPEQVQGQPITTATDVYSLGVVLYLLLCGRRPYEVKGAGVTEVARVVSDTVVPLPSMVATKGSDARQISGDLDAIVRHAMDRDADRRYRSVERLSDDIRRYLERRPVSARPSTISYRLTKFMGRHRVAVAGCALALISLVVGMTTTVWQARVASRERARAERRLSDVRHLANSFMFEIHDAIVNIPGTTKARALMVRRALEYLDSLAVESSEDRSLQEELAAAYIKVGDAQGNPSGSNLGDLTGAKKSYQRAIEISQSLTKDGRDSEARRTLALAYRKQGDVLAWSGHVSEAVASSRASLEIYQELALTQGASPEARFQLGVAHIKLGDLVGNSDFPNAGHLEEAVQQYELARPILTDMAGANPHDERTSRYLGIVYERLGHMAESANDLDRALGAYQASFDIRARLASENLYHTDIQRDHAIANEKIGNVLRAQGRYTEALTHYRASLSMFETLAAEDRSNENATRSLAISYEKMGDAFRDSSQAAEAASRYKHALGIHESLIAHDPSNAQAKKDLAGLNEKLHNLSSRPEPAK